MLYVFNPPPLDISSLKPDNIPVLTGQLSQVTTKETSFANNVWQEVFDWLKNLSPNIPDGEQLIRDRDIYANFITTETQPREKLTMEAHKKYIDLHFCISGGERIEWSLAEILVVEKGYDFEKDVALLTPPTTADSRLMTSGKFAIFFPDEAHMPKITDGINKTVKKVVVKIKADLII